MAARTHIFQPPKGTRDFYPADMAVRRYIEKVWREVSINHGFEEIEGPNFEHLELYTIKSGEGIVSELFSFRREGGDTDYALRPEFTPTLARMYAAKANSLPKPVKWFCIPNHFRAERPQRGRLREFLQWNIDIIGDDSPRADAEIITTTIGMLSRFGFTEKHLQIKLNHRDIPKCFFIGRGANLDQIDVLFDLTDRYHKTSKEDLRRRGHDLGVSDPLLNAIDHLIEQCHTEEGTREILDEASKSGFDPENEFLELLDQNLASPSIKDWFKVDPSIVRGLAYYTGTVFEVHETAGKERAVAGGGRYDGLIELFGGPPTPAVGIAMGDVVLRLLLEQAYLLKPEERMPRPDVFIISNGEEEAERRLPQLVSQLRSDGFHTRHTYKTTRNVGKLLGEASKARSRFTIILGSELEQGKVLLKNLDDGKEDPIAIEEITITLRNLLKEG